MPPVVHSTLFCMPKDLGDAKLHTGKPENKQSGLNLTANWIHQLAAFLPLLVCHAAFAATLSAEQPNLVALKTVASNTVALNRGQSIKQERKTATFSNAARLLAVADRQLELGNQSTAFDALQAIFATGDASFPTIKRTKNDASVYDMAIQRLKSATVVTRAEWSRRTEISARVDLDQSNQTSGELRILARKYPFTKSGLTADLLLIRNMISRRQSLTAAASVKRLQDEYAGITVNFPARAMIAMAARQVLEYTTGQASPKTVASELPPTTNPASTFSSWQPVWTFKEPVWNTPQLIGTFGGISRPNARSALTTNSWQPTFDDDKIVLRTPKRIVCLNSTNGFEHWSISTDTVTQNSYERLLANGSQPSESGQLTEVLRSNNFGSMTHTSDFLFFVDHFRSFESNDASRNMINQRLNRSRLLPQSSQQNGTRLVAVRLTAPPTIAWTTDTNTDFQYDITIGKHPEEGRTEDVEGKQPTARNTDRKLEVPLSNDNAMSSFEGHRFLGPPLLFEQSLFVLTADADTIWLNCLLKGTGRLSWRRSISYQDSLDEDPFRRMNVKPKDIGASIVGISDNTILSLLNTGLVVGSSLSDGRVKWTTSLTDAESQTPLPRSARYLRETRSFPSFPPILQGDQLIWASAQSDHLYCMNASTGAIQWRIPRVSNAPGQADRSKDLLPAGIINDQLIMTGDRHVRAIDVNDGKVAWTTGLNSPCGKAVLIDNTCWVPILNGCVVPVDAMSGERGVPLKCPIAVAGSLYHTKNRIIAVTPISVQAFPLFDNSHNEQQSTPASTVTQQQLAKTLNSIRKLKQKLEPDESMNSRIVNDVKSLPSKQRRIVVDYILSTAANDKQLASVVGDWSVLPMSNTQRLRQQLLLGQKIETDSNSAADLIPVTDDWNVRLDLAASDSNENLRSGVTEKTANEIASQPIGLQRQWLQRAGRSFQTLANRLETNRPAAAELALLMSESSVKTDSDRLAIRQELDALRTSPVGQTSQAASVPIKSSEGSVFDRSDLKFTAEQEFRLAMATPLSQLTALSRQPITIASPSPFVGRRLFLQDRKLFSVDLNIGSVARSLQLSATPDRVIPSDTALDPFTPSLLPIVGQSHVGVVSLVNQVQPAELWWKRWDRAAYDNTPLRSGPVTPSGIIFASNHRITCLHPLTGAMLWWQNFSTGSTQSVFSRQVGFAADAEHVIALSPGYRSGTVFRMTDGKQLASVTYNVPPEITPIISGTRLLFPERNRLKLIDLATGDDLLADVQLDIYPSSSAQLLTTTRAVVITGSQEIAVVDLKSARVEYKVKLPPELLKQQSSGIQAFEEGGRLIIHFRQWNGRTRELSASSVVGDRRLTPGILVSIDPRSGEQWSKEIPASVLMEIAGDSAPLLMLWSRQSQRNNTLQGFDQRNYSPAMREDKLLLRVVDQRTGREMLRTQELGWANPLRCFHDSESQTITIETDASEIRLRYTSKPSDSE